MPLTTNAHACSRMHNEDERVLIIAPVGQDADAMAALLNAEGFETQICACGAMNVPDKSRIAQARYCLRRKRWSQRKFRIFWTSLKRSRPGPNYRSSFSQAAANRAGQDYWIWRLRLPEL